MAESLICTYEPVYRTMLQNPSLECELVNCIVTDIWQMTHNNKFDLQARNQYVLYRSGTCFEYSHAPSLYFDISNSLAYCTCAREVMIDLINPATRLYFQRKKGEYKISLLIVSIKGKRGRHVIPFLVLTSRTLHSSIQLRGDKSSPIPTV
jgi:hypothetical protein